MKYKIFQIIFYVSGLYLIAVNQQWVGFQNEMLNTLISIYMVVFGTYDYVTFKKKYKKKTKTENQ